MIQSLPLGAANPGAYRIDDAPYGARIAFPNIGSRKRLIGELAWAQSRGLRGTELSEGMTREAIRQVAETFAGSDCLYVVSLDGRMFLMPSEFDGMETTHTMPAGAIDVIAAGHVLFDQRGYVVGWNHLSGHYRPDELQAWEVAHAVFKLTGLLMSSSTANE
jgi:hypothetical protein